MPAITQELAIGIGYKKQAGTGLATTTKTEVQTPLLAADLWSLNLNAFNLPAPTFMAEDDAEFYGKGDEFARTVFPTSIDAPWEWPFHLTSQNWAQTICFAIPGITETPATLWVWTGEPDDSLLDVNRIGLNLHPVAWRLAAPTLHLAFVGSAQFDHFCPMSRPTQSRRELRAWHVERHVRAAL